MTIHVVRPGFFTTIQDAGRYGWQSLGVGPGGAMDLVALRIANALVGNHVSMAGLELTLIGPVLRFERSALIAITGAVFTPTIDGEAITVGRAVRVRSGAELMFGACGAGCRGYLAVAGGIDVPPVLGSRSTHLRARFGGFEGRALRAGDRLPVGAASPEGQGLAERLSGSRRKWAPDGTGFSRDINARPQLTGPVRLLPGAQLESLTAGAREQLFDAAYRVSAQSDRMGYRLEGPELAMPARTEMTSEGVAAGTVQLPPDGRPIILLADRQTTGGYPVIAHVATIDLGAVAQRKPGDEIRFAPISLDLAHQALLARERTIAGAIQALRRQRAQE